MFRIVVLIALAACLATPSSSLASTVTGFQLNLPGLDSDFATSVSGIDGMQFDAGVRLLSHTSGTQYLVQGYARITGYTGASNTGNLNGASGMGTPYELTALFSNGGYYTGYDAATGTSYFNHVAGTGSLDLYFDDLSDGSGSQADLASGTGFADGQLLASSLNTSFGGGSLSSVDGSGGDITEYQFTSLLDNAFLTLGGQDFIPDGQYGFQLSSSFGYNYLPSVADPVWQSLFGIQPEGFIPTGVVYEYGDITMVDFDEYTAPVPLPAAAYLLAAGLGGLGILRRTRM